MRAASAKILTMCSVPKFLLLLLLLSPQQKMGKFAMNGKCGVEGGREEALVWFKKAAAQGNENAKRELAGMKGLPRG